MHREMLYLGQVQAAVSYTHLQLSEGVLHESSEFRHGLCQRDHWRILFQHVAVCTEHYPVYHIFHYYAAYDLSLIHI